MKIQKIIETFLLESTIKLTDMYDDDELNDETEELYHYVDEDDFNKEFTIHIMTPEEAKTYVTSRNDKTVYQAYLDHASKEQKRLIADKAKHFNDNRVIVTMFKTIVDGNHQLIAGILANKPIKYINLAD